MRQNRLLLLLALLMTVATGTWATPNSIVINGTPQVGDKSISLTYHFEPANVPGINSYAPTLKVKCAADNKWDEMPLSLTEVSSGTTIISLSNLGEFKAGKTYEVCFAYNNGSWVDDVFQSFVPAAPATYTVTLAEGTEDADKWTISPNPAEEGATVTVTYSGAKKVKSVKAVKKGGVTLATPMTIEAITAGTIIVTSPKAGMQYSLNGGAKTAVPDGTAIDVAVGDKVAFYGDGTNITSYYTANTNFTKISGGTAEVKVYGNIMSLVDETGFATNTTLPDTHTFYGLFSGTSSSDNNTNLKDASGLLLPATELQSYCYSSMFSYCTALTAAPKLPATALAQYCYNSMFRDCTNLTTAPELPATTLAEYCYMNMFNGCKALTTAPELKATTLVNSCYWQMFRNCKNLNSVTCLATDISARDCTYYWLYSVSATGTFTKASSMTSWTADSHSGIPSGWTTQDYSE